MTAFGDYPLSAVVHAQQSLSIPRPLDFCGELVVETRVLWVKATRRGAFVGVRSIAADQLTATEAVQLTRTIFVKDAHAQDEGTAALNDSTVPENRPPDFEMTGKTSNSQAVLFAQNGDNNPIHLDPVMARARGFERPILHGLCTLGIADRLFSGRSSPAPAGTVMAMRCRFVAEAYPGSKLVAKAWRSRGRLDFQVYSDNLLVIDHGQMSFSIPGE
ncbi:MaoC/PaaZ C-terminal domain-containing protein [Paeniglutamicibacter sp. MACA_103]|uniref:MaoC/PaaZ C-terminal domain-containing protein n=1 Tax=Paeniglutamicibacter sp. MACA_103 TaxID=3377337 RepID=UPI003894CB22